MDAHIVNPMTALGGSEIRSIEIAALLSRHARTRIWTEYERADCFAGLSSLRCLRPRMLRFPRRGAFVFIGAYFYVGNWWRLVRPDRVCMIYNASDADAYRMQLDRLSRDGRIDVACGFASEWLRESVGGDGPVIPSWVDTNRFIPRLRATSHAEPVTVGRLSRDIRIKHADDDPALYASLTKAKVVVRVMGGECLRAEFTDIGAVQLIRCGAMDPVSFLQSLDVFVYRTGPAWREACGRVVAEAMCCGLPIVCDGRGGYTEFVDDGRTGFITRSTGEAREAILELSRNPALRSRMGSAARDAMLARFSDEERQRQVEWMLGSLRSRRFV